MPSEFQAVLLCGNGHDLYPFTEEGQIAKSLLPIGNKPLIYYSLHWLESSGLTGE